MPLAIQSTLPLRAALATETLDMNMVLRRFLESNRWAGATLFVTLLYLGLQNLQMVLLQEASRRGWLVGDVDGSLADEARRVAETSAALEPRLDLRHRQMAWRLGVRLGYASEMLGSVARSAPAVQAATRQQLAGMLDEAARLGDELGVGRVEVLPARTAREFGDLRLRIENDELGLAARLEQRLTPRARHLFLAGMHVGSALASFDSGAGIIEPLAGNEIARHAVLAGVPESLWRPLAFAVSENQADAAARYRQALEALDAALAAP